MASCPSVAPGLAVPWGWQVSSSQPCSPAVAEAKQQQAQHLLRPSTVSAAGGKRHVGAARPASARCSVRVDVAEPVLARLHCWLGSVHGECRSKEAAVVDVGSWSGSGDRQGCMRAERGLWPVLGTREGLPWSCLPQILLLKHLCCRWGRVGLTQPRMRTWCSENRMWCAETGRKLPGAHGSPSCRQPGRAAAAAVQL